MPEGASESPRARRAGWLLLLVLILGVGALAYSSLARLEHPPGSDVDYYVLYMRAVADEGVAVFPRLFRTYLADHDDWLYPNPTRLAFITTSAVWSRLFGADAQALARLALASHLALIALVYAYATRWFGVARGLQGAALVAFSALGMGLARQALSDSFATLTQAAAVCAFLEYLRTPSRLRALFASTTFGLALLSKELALLLAVPLCVHALVEHRRRKSRLPLHKIALVLVLPGLVCAGLLILAAGGLGTLLGVVDIVLTSPATNEYALAFGSGSWARYPIDELLMSPAPTLVGLAGVAAAFLAWRRGEYRPQAVALAFLYVLQIAALAPFTKNLRYIAVLEVPLRLLAALFLWELCAAERARFGRVFASLAVVALCWCGWRDYRHVWITWRIYDPLTVVLAGVRGLVPLDPDYFSVPGR